jgi:hypothetical protein
MQRVFRPAAAQYFAAALPHGPAPTTTTSYMQQNN